jgi:hypothetical protein
MNLNNCCALFLLALVACQAAPSSKMMDKSISESETTFTKNDIQLEDVGAEKDRTKKSATTFCVEVRSGKPEQVPCKQELRPQGFVQQETSKPVVIVQPIPIPAPASVIQYPKQPIMIQPYQLQPQPQAQPPQSINAIQQQQSLQTTNINYPQAHVAPIPQSASQHIGPIPASIQTPVPIQTPAPAPIPIINIVPPAPAPVPCEKPTIVQPQQPQQIHTVHVIHPQPQPTPRPFVTVIKQEVKPQNEKKLVPPKPQVLPIPQPHITLLPQKSPCQKCKLQTPPSRPLSFIVQPSVPYINVERHVESGNCDTQEEAYECNCRPENRIPLLTPYVPSRFTGAYKIQGPRAMVYPGEATFESSMPYRSSMISTENNPSIMSDQPILYTSEGAREAV